MAKKSGISKHDREMAELLRLGGKKIPPGLTAKASAATKAMLLKRLDAEKGLWLQGARLYSKLKGGSPITVDDPENRETLDAILRLHNKAAGKKLAFPKVAPALGQPLGNGAAPVRIPVCDGLPIFFWRAGHDRESDRVVDRQSEWTDQRKRDDSRYSRHDGTLCRP